MDRLLIVAIFIISTLPLYAQDQAPDAAKLKADTQKVASIIKADGAKTQTYCQIADLAYSTGSTSPVRINSYRS